MRPHAHAERSHPPRMEVTRLREFKVTVTSADGSIVQALHEIQKRCGYLPKPELEALAERRRDVTLHRLHEVASFFPHFLLEPPAGGRGEGLPGHGLPPRGAAEACRGASQGLAAGIGRGQCVVEGVSCLGRCDAAPAVTIGEHVYWGRTTSQYEDLLRTALPGPDGGPRTCPRSATTGAARLEDRPVRRARGVRGRPAVRREPGRRRPDRGAQGRRPARHGGAGVSAHQKWKDVRQARGDDEVRRLQRRRERARHVQGPRAAAADPPPGHRGDDPRRARSSAPSGATSTSATSTRSRSRRSREAIARAGRPRRLRRRTSSAPAGRSRSRSSSAPAATSAASRAP